MWRPGHRAPLPAWRVLARGGVHAAAIGGDSALRGTADTLLDAASYGVRWVLLSPAPAAGVVRATDSDQPSRRRPAAPVGPGPPVAPPPALTVGFVGGSSRDSWGHLRRDLPGPGRRPRQPLHRLRYIGRLRRDAGSEEIESRPISDHPIPTRITRE